MRAPCPPTHAQAGGLTGAVMGVAAVAASGGLLFGYDLVSLPRLLLVQHVLLLEALPEGLPGRQLGSRFAGCALDTACHHLAAPSHTHPPPTPHPSRLSQGVTGGVESMPQFLEKFFPSVYESKLAAENSPEATDPCESSGASSGGRVCWRACLRHGQGSGARGMPCARALASSQTAPPHTQHHPPPPHHDP